VGGGQDIDSIATEQEICAAIASQYGIDAERIRVRSLRRGYAESQSGSELQIARLSAGDMLQRKRSLGEGWRTRSSTGPTIHAPNAAEK